MQKIKQPVRLTLGCDNDMMLVLRMTTVGVLAQSSFGLDRADEIKLAVDEAAKQFMAASDMLMVEYDFLPDGLKITLGAQNRAPITPNPDEWMVLQCVLESMGCEVNAVGGDAPCALELICHA